MKFRDYFVRQPDGSWKGPREMLYLKGPQGGQVSIPPGQRLRPHDTKLVGLDIAQLCEDDADIDDYIARS